MTVNFNCKIDCTVMFVGRSWVRFLEVLRMQVCQTLHSVLGCDLIDVSSKIIGFMMNQIQDEGEEVSIPVCPSGIDFVNVEVTGYAGPLITGIPVHNVHIQNVKMWFGVMDFLDVGDEDDYDKCS